jgi:preprotein translocase subunit SecA/nephrocystin-3
MSYNNNGNDYKKLGEYEKALEYHLKALKIYKKVLGPKHSNTKNLLKAIEIVKAKIKE